MSTKNTEDRQQSAWYNLKELFSSLPFLIIVMIASLCYASYQTGARSESKNTMQALELYEQAQETKLKCYEIIVNGR